MKEYLKKILSSLLVLSITLCGMTVFVSAEGSADDGAEEIPEVEVLLHRTYEEGWDYDNGFTNVARRSQNYLVDYEQGKGLFYNYFFRQTSSVAGYDSYAEIGGLDEYILEEGYLFLELSVMVDDFANLGRLIISRSPGGVVNGKTTELLSMANNTVYFGENEIGNIAGRWVHLVYRFSFSGEAGVPDHINLYVADSTKADAQLTEIYNGDLASTDGVQLFRFGIQTNAANNGHSWCIDNLRLYNTIYPDRQDITDMGYGSLLDENDTKTVVIKNFTGEKSNVEYLNEAMLMKTRVNYAYIDCERVPLFDGTYGAPVNIDGVVYVPLIPLLDYAEYSYAVHTDGVSYDLSSGTNTIFMSVGRNVATLNGKRVELSAAPICIGEGDTGYVLMALDDVETCFPGIYTTYDNMGLIVIAERDNLLHRDNDLQVMLEKMKAFVFDYPTGKEVYDDVLENTNGFQHPYLMASQEQFDYIHEVYLSKYGEEGYNSDVNKMITAVMKKADAHYKNYAYLGSKGEYVRIVQKSDNRIVGGLNAGRHNPYEDGTGYDPNNGNRLDEAGEYAAEILELAMGYQITRDVKYLRLAYDYMIVFGNWKHWGPGHFLDCSGATMNYALAFDWLYNAFEEYSDEYGFDTTKLASNIFWRGVSEGYCTVVGQPCSDGKSSYYTTRDSNWNAVCAAGMTIGALAIMGYSEYEGSLSKTNSALADMDFTYWDTCRDAVISKSLFGLVNYGADFYAPDGSYPEGSGYWAYGTNNFFRLCAAFDSAAGTNYGTMECWGMDTTCYYALHSESSDYSTWNYHDGGSGKQDTSMFGYVGQYFGDLGLCSVRNLHIREGKTATVYDLVFYRELDETEIDLSLDYHMEGISAAVSRSSWERGATYIGLMGGPNICNHGDIDSGNFILYAKGVRWIYDLGSDNYNAYNYFSNAWRYKLYRKNAEGQNLIFLTSQQATVPYGLSTDGDGKIIDFYSGEHGSYTILDNTSSFGGYAVLAKRGMMMTNDRETVILQDEITFGSVESVCWLVHTRSNVAGISEDGRTAYLSHKVGVTTYYLRASIVAESDRYKFVQLGAGDRDLILDATWRAGQQEALGGKPEYGRSDIRRLAIFAENVTMLNLAVVFEFVGSSKDATPPAYEFAYMSTWEPKESFESTAITTERVVKSDIPLHSFYLDFYRDAGDQYTTNLSNYYERLVKIDKTMLVFQPKELNATELEAYNNWLEHLDEYDAYKALISSHRAKVHSIAKALEGV
ncbi:MAG: hypothetical protein IJX97_04140 [Clostridia bacterium]|nr:hypothetical protein [Clostridia bacterium]MBQ8720068.1 hypothetical protein [Clostridia bacterium]